MRRFHTVLLLTVLAVSVALNNQNEATLSRPTIRRGAANVNDDTNDGDEIECDVKEVIYDGQIMNGTDDMALHCLMGSSELSYEIDGLTYEDAEEIQKAVRQSSKGYETYTFTGAKIAKMGKGKRKGTDALNVGKGGKAKKGGKGGKGGKGKNGNPDRRNRDRARERHLQVSREGNKTVIVLRVLAPDSQVQKSSEELRMRVFGGGEEDDDVNLSMQMSACSYGKLNLVPPPHNPLYPGLVDGVADVTIPDNVSGVSSGSVRNMVIPEAEKVVGSLNQYNFVMYVLPGAVSFGGAAAWAYMPGRDSVYREAYSDKTWVQMHEVGHSLGMHHSGQGSSAYGDASGYMGSGNYGAEPRMCFNAQKSSYLGWYADRDVTLDVTTVPASFTGKLIGVSDYGNAEGYPAEDYAVVLHVDTPAKDLFLTYNRKDGFNIGTSEAGDTVTVVDGQPGMQKTSDLLSTLTGNQVGSDEYVMKDFGGLGNPLVIRVNDIGSDGLIDWAQVTVDNVCTDDEQCTFYDTCTSGMCVDGVCTSGPPLADCCGNGICEPEVGESCSTCGGDCCIDNLALDKTATQSSDYPYGGGLAGLANDGNTDGRWSQGSVTHTDVQCDPWWKVDLGAEHLVSNLRVFNRADCCSDRLSNFEVDVIDSNDVVTQTITHSGEAGSPTHLTLEDGSVRDGYVGRYVRIQLIGCDEPLSLAEVEVYAATTTCGNGVCEADESCGTCASDCCSPNLALNGAAAQSSTYWAGGGADLAVDGNTDGRWSVKSITHTNSQCQPWWNVDLGEDHLVSFVRVHNRVDCCSDRLSNFVVETLDAGRAVVSTLSHPEEAGPVTEFHFDGGSLGRFVQVRLLDCNVLSLAEVEVFSDLSANDPPSTSSPSQAPVATPEPTTSSPTHQPTTKSPTRSPTPEPTTSSPTHQPTTKSPTRSPTPEPTTSSPTPQPTTKSPTRSPTPEPTTSSPTPQPTTQSPTRAPTPEPTTSSPTPQPTTKPPTRSPTPEPTTSSPTPQPSTKSPTEDGVTSAPTTSSAPENLALGKNAMHSSVYPYGGGDASNAVDGNTDGDWKGGSVTHTGFNQCQEWWKVDLGEDRFIGSIVLYNRVDCCSSRLSNFVVEILDASEDVVSIVPHADEAGPVTQLDVANGLLEGSLGRFVRVRLLGCGVLSLAEVEVYAAATTATCGNDVCEANESCGACPADCCPANLALNKDTSQSSDGWSGVSSRAVDGNTDGSWSSGSVTHTNGQECEPWWQVDMGSDYLVPVVHLYNRVDSCCSDRLSNFEVDLVDSNDVGTTVAHPGVVGIFTDIVFPEGSHGQFVRIRLLDCGVPLSLAEVEVYGQPMSNPSL